MLPTRAPAVLVAPWGDRVSLADAVRRIGSDMLARVYPDLVPGVACAWVHAPPRVSDVRVYVCAPRATGMLAYAEYAGTVTWATGARKACVLQEAPVRVWTWFVAPGRRQVHTHPETPHAPRRVWARMWAAYDAQAATGPAAAAAASSNQR